MLRGRGPDKRNRTLPRDKATREKPTGFSRSAEPNEPAYEVHLMKESNGYWRFELPDTLTGQNFYNNLTASVQKLIDNKDRLPGSKDKAYERAVAWLTHEMAFPSTGKAGKGEAVPASEKK